MIILLNVPPLLLFTFFFSLEFPLLFPSSFLFLSLLSETVTFAFL